MSKPPVTIKKYANRRLYDTEDSRYVTLDEVADKLRRGTDVRVVDADSGDDLTQATLVQLILESRGAGKLLPVPLLTQLVRLGDDALAEFFSTYLSWALETYVTLRRGAPPVNPWAAYGASPFGMANPFARMPPMASMSPMSPWGDPMAGAAAPPAPPPPPPPPPSTVDDDLAAMRRELEELKRAMPKKKPRKLMLRSSK